MKKVKVDIAELEYAFDNCSIEQEFFLEIDTGEIIFVSESFDTEEKNEKFYEKMDKEPGKYLTIPERGSREAYQQMLQFARRVGDKVLQEKLEIALDGKGAFRRFKNVLYGYPKQRQKWFDFCSKEIKKRIKEWLEENDLELMADG